MLTLDGPDKARCWIIVFAAWIINSLLSGVSRSSGIFYVALIDNYGVTRQQANVPFTLRNCVRNLSGPLVGYLGQRFTIRTVTVIGCLLAVSGIVLCSVAPNITWLSVFWGGVHGLGIALGNTLYYVTINQYFVKYRATAVGIAMSGSCLGSFFLPAYGLQGTFLLTGGLMMQVLPAAITLKDPSWLDTNLKRRNTHSQKDTELSEKNTKIDAIEDSKQTFTNNDEKLGHNTKNNDNSATQDVKKRNDVIWISLLNMHKNPMFLMISVSFAIVVLILDPYLTVIVDYIKDKGLNEEDGKYLISAFSLGDLAGRLCFGWAIDTNFLSVQKFIMISMIIQGICVATLPFFNMLSMFVVLAILYGLAVGLAIVLFPLLVAKYLPLQQTLAMGSFGFMSGLLFFAVPSIIGYFRDYGGSYNNMFHIGGCISILIGSLWMFQPFLI